MLVCWSLPLISTTVKLSNICGKVNSITNPCAPLSRRANTGYRRTLQWRGNCNICAEQKSLVSKTKQCEIWLRLKGGVKKSFQLYDQFSLKDLIKVGLNLVHFAWTEVSKMKPRVICCAQKAPFLPRNKINEYLTNIYS